MNTLQKIIIERYAAKKYASQKFSYRQYLDLQKKLVQKNINDQKAIKECEESISSLKENNRPRHITNDKLALIDIVSFVAGAATGVGYAAVNNGDMFDYYNCLLCGLIGGGVAGIANMTAYATKPVENTITNAIIKSKDRKIRRLENRKELRNYTLYCFRQQERENTPTLEDFLRAIKDSDLTM